METLVNYLGQGLHVTEDKVEEFLLAPIPTNMQKLLILLPWEIAAQFSNYDLPITLATATKTNVEV